MKRRISAVFILVVFILSAVFATGLTASATSGGSAKVSLIVTEPSVRRGQTFYITFSVENRSAHDISALDFAITFNSADFEFCNVKYNGNSYKKISLGVVDSNTSKIDISYEAFTGNNSILVGTVLNAEMALEMKYVGTGYISDMTSQFDIINLNAMAEPGYTNTDREAPYTFTSSELVAQGANIVLKALSDVNTLAGIDLAVGNKKLTLEPAFSPEVTEYTTYVEYSKSSIKANFPRTDTYGSTVSHNFGQHTNTGSNKFYIIVTAENGSTRTYNIDMHIIPQGMTIDDYKAYLANQASSSSAPAQEEPAVESEPVISQTDEPDTEEEPGDDQPLVFEDESASDAQATVSSVPEKKGGIAGLVSRINPAVLIAAIGGLILLVAGGFTAGYVSHKKSEHEKMLMGMTDYYTGDNYYSDQYEDEYGGYDEYDYGGYDAYNAEQPYENQDYYNNNNNQY